MIPVVWLNRHADDGIATRGIYFDRGTLEALLRRDLWIPPGFPRLRHAYEVPEGPGPSLVVLPARHHASDVGWVNEQLERMGSCVVILTGDEEGDFPYEDMVRRPTWVQTPYPRHSDTFGFGDGWPPGTREVLRDCETEATERPLDWMFCGQINHDGRRSLVRVLKQLRGRPHVLSETPGFTQGVDQETYLRTMASAKVVPCPSGIFTVDTFRLFEALEAGCVPVTTNVSPTHGDYGYWQDTFGEVPFPVVGNWTELHRIVAEVCDTWPAHANRCQSWWQGRKRDLAYRLRDDLASIDAELPEPTPEGHVTFLVPTSPVRCHPDTTGMETTLASIRLLFPFADILIMCDGVREEQQNLSSTYHEYVRRLLWKAEHEWTNTWPIVYDEHLHQAEMARRTLEKVHTPLVGFVEHDTPLLAPIDVEGCVATLLADEVDLIRFHHEARILDEHLHLMPDGRTPWPARVPLLRTSQWSQRPHLARTDFYERVLAEHFDLPRERWFIEDRMHSPVQGAWEREGEEGWKRYRLCIYAPDGDMKRSEHLDMRGEEPKWGPRSVG